MAESNSEAAERGFTAGQIDARLAGHDKHFEKINGSIDRLADEIHTMNLGMQRLADDAKANAKTVITTAAALKDAEAARRDKSETSWSPWARGFVVIGGVSAVVAVVVTVLLKG
jgi:hypothetical protein